MDVKIQQYMSCPVYKEDIVKTIKFKLDNKEQGRKSN
jgi:hypothetical protein